jgi:hypothetical protein
MEFSLAELIEDSMKVENVDKRKVIKILTDYIKSGCDEKEIYECVYKEVYKDTLLPEMCEEWISVMGNEEHSGAKWISVMGNEELEDVNPEDFGLNSVRKGVEMFLQDPRF